MASRMRILCRITKSSLAATTFGHRSRSTTETRGVDPVDASYRGEVAQRWRYRDGRGEFGVIASVTQPFCGDCTRARISAEGKLFTCLFAIRGHDLRALLRSGASDDDIEASLRQVWSGRGDRYSELGEHRGHGRIDVLVRARDFVPARLKHPRERRHRRPADSD